eukprot:TRINITY_DN13804_c0_g2_i1.p1 TRINITY_DN13804_c0_g2~~TRINITY_DN13804_c0_g2_i1.p1  ORF type:complete len:300 (-),score=64.81 TRINITY_DN13804_c0_g2_i1:46-945(-)
MCIRDRQSTWEMNSLKCADYDYHSAEDQIRAIERERDEYRVKWEVLNRQVLTQNREWEIQVKNLLRDKEELTKRLAEHDLLVPSDISHRNTSLQLKDEVLRFKTIEIERLTTALEEKEREVERLRIDPNSETFSQGNLLHTIKNQANELEQYRERCLHAEAELRRLTLPVRPGLISFTGNVGEVEILDERNRQLEAQNRELREKLHQKDNDMVIELSRIRLEAAQLTESKTEGEMLRRKVAGLESDNQYLKRKIAELEERLLMANRSTINDIYHDIRSAYASRPDLLSQMPSRSQHSYY